MVLPSLHDHRYGYANKAQDHGYRYQSVDLVIRRRVK
jgi:hypothetical protein